MTRLVLPYSQPVKLTYWAAKGLYQKVIGKVGRYEGEDYDIHLVETTPKKFYLGGDRTAAEEAASRLERLWVAMQDAGVPVWNLEPLYLNVAKAIIRGDHHFEVAPGPLRQGDSSIEYTQYINELNRHYNKSMRFVPLTEAVFKHGQEQFKKVAADHLAEARRASAIAGEPSLADGGPRVHQAVDAFATHIRASFLTKDADGQPTTSEWGHRFSAAILRLKDACTDVSLGQFGFDAISAAATCLRHRPKSKKNGQPLAIETVRMQFKALRRFVDWLDTTDQFEWTEPRKIKKAMGLRVDEIKTDQERSTMARGARVRTYSVDELTLLYKYATQWERLLLLLGINFAFAQAEIQSLRLTEIDLEHGQVRRVRRKTGVYGKFQVWPETGQLLAWAVARRKAQTQDCDGRDIAATPESLTILTDKGQPVYHLTESGNRSDSVARAWTRLVDRVRVDHPEFRRLGFKFLRKTSGDLVRRFSNGEVAGVFMSRGKVVESDDQADEYTHRPFDRVFIALERVHDLLQPMFAARPQGVLDEVVKKGGPNISRRVIEDIQNLAAKGVPTGEIAQALGVSGETVRRHARSLTAAPQSVN